MITITDIYKFLDEYMYSFTVRTRIKDEKAYIVFIKEEEAKKEEIQELINKKFPSTDITVADFYKYM